MDSNHEDYLNKIDLYDLFNIEYNDVIFDLYDEINEYSNSSYVNFYNKGNIGNFINLLYNNIDYENSSLFLNNMRKIRLKEYEIDINEYNYDINDEDYSN